MSGTRYEHMIQANMELCHGLTSSCVLLSLQTSLQPVGDSAETGLNSIAGNVICCTVSSINVGLIQPCT